MNFVKMLLVSLVSNNLSKYGRRHFELFTVNVSWDRCPNITQCSEYLKYEIHAIIREAKKAL